MRKNNIIKLILVTVFLISTLSAQILYKESILSEQGRRNIYKLDDWKGYGNIEDVQYITSDNKYIYLATWGSGIWRFNKVTEEWEYPLTNCSGLPDNYVSWVQYDKYENVLFAATATDTAVFNFGFDRWEHKSKEPFWKHSTPSNPVLATEELQPGIFYGRNSLDKLAYFNLDNPDYMLLVDWIIQDKEFREYTITGFYYDDYDHIFLIAKNLGVILGKKTDVGMQIYEMGHHAIFPKSFYFTDDAIWYGGTPSLTGYSSIVKWKNNNEFEHFSAKSDNRMYSDDVRYIAGKNSELYFATNMGVVVYNEEKDIWRTFDQNSGLVNENVFCLMVEDTTLWVGTREGLSFINLNNKVGKSRQRLTFNNQSINKFYKYKNDYYMASSLGLYHKKEGEFEWSRVEVGSIFTSMFFTAVAANDTVIWVAGEYGIARQNRKTGYWESFPGLHSQLSGNYNDIVFYRDGIFIATDDGLIRYDEKFMKWQLYTTTDGLFDNRVNQLHLENGILWMTTRAGICQFYWRRHQF